MLHCNNKRKWIIRRQPSEPDRSRAQLEGRFLHTKCETS
jgi:hypothetical protein